MLCLARFGRGDGFGRGLRWRAREDGLGCEAVHALFLFRLFDHDDDIVVEILDWWLYLEITYIFGFI